MFERKLFITLEREGGDSDWFWTGHRFFPMEHLTNMG